MVQPNNHSPHCWISNIYTCLNNSHIRIWDWKVRYSFQGIGGAFLGYRVDEGIRCIALGYSCFKRLFENPWCDLIHKTKILCKKKLLKGAQKGGKKQMNFKTSIFFIVRTWSQFYKYLSCLFFILFIILTKSR